MKKTLLQALVAILFVMSGTASAQIVHVINFCNTLDPNIGCEVDYERTKQETGLIAANLNYGIRYYDGIGQNCSKEKLMSTLNSLKCSKNDIVIFYYSGHGTRSKQDKSEFPQMCLKYNNVYDEDKFVAVHTVAEKLQEKGARFTLVMTDCCNNPVQGVSAKTLMSKDGSAMTENKTVARNYRKLFLENQGMIVVTSSKKGQMSLGGKRNGGLFTDQFYGNSLYSAVHGQIPATWDNVLKNAYGLVKGLAAQVNNHVQEPYYEIKLRPNVTTPPPTPASTAVPVIAAEPTFASEMATVLDESQSEEWRLNQVNYLANKYFTTDSKVVTVGRNGTTILENEAARLYLRRIACSGQISKINVVKEKKDASGKHSYIKVQEIRKSK
ncbi:MAG: caspase family protein [Bacteroidales bacterium]|nr:caspase family protein [Bacteroidales bacterium]